MAVNYELGHTVSGGYLYWHLQTPEGEYVSNGFSPWPQGMFVYPEDIQDGEIVPTWQTWEELGVQYRWFVIAHRSGATVYMVGIGLAHWNIVPIMELGEVRVIKASVIGIEDDRYYVIFCQYPITTQYYWLGVDLHPA